jgi:uncharacterized membrane protein (UPF0136 family)
MPPSVTSISNRSQTMVSALFALVVVMGISPVFDIIVVRLPIRFGEVPWRFQTFQLLLANGPQFAILLSLLALFGALFGNRILVRAVAVALAVIAVITVVVLPLFTLDYFQAARLIPQGQKGGFRVTTMKTMAFAALLVVGCVWAAIKGWQASEPPDPNARRAKGEGLVVGQPKDATSSNPT